jgi:hypothetical protein
MLSLKFLFLVFSLMIAAAVPAQSKGPMDMKELVSGADQAEWSQRWWQWAFSFERARSPVADRTGQYCASRQSGEVWFLAGTFGSRRTERTCKIPVGKYLFFPVVNYLAFLAEGSQETCASLIARVSKVTDSPSAMALEVDGVRYEAAQIHRIPSGGCFSLVPGGPQDASSNGYYVMLPPLSPGLHIIEFAGVLPTLVQAVTYRITVE